MSRDLETIEIGQDLKLEQGTHPTFVLLYDLINEESVVIDVRDIDKLRKALKKAKKWNKD